MIGSYFMSRRIVLLSFVLSVFLAISGCGDSGGGGGGSESDIAVTFSALSANGSSTETTTALTLTFSQAIAGLTADDITLNGVAGVVKGALSGSGGIYSLPISGFAAGGTLSVSVSKTGYEISAYRTAAIYFYNSGGQESDIEVTFSALLANGSSTKTTTALTLTFSQAIAGLTADDITLNGVAGVVKGALSGSGGIYTLPISGFAAGGTLSVSVSKTGYDISGTPMTADIYVITYEIRDADDLNNIRLDLAGIYRLMADVSLLDYGTGEGWEPIGDNITPFTGSLHGNGYAIKDLYINGTTYAGLFGYIDGGKVSNLGVEIASGGVSGQYAGGIAGYVDNGAITNSYSTGNISASAPYAHLSSTSSYGGGIAGYVDNGAITNSYSTGNISASAYSSYAGGIAGRVIYGTITNSYSTGNITSSSPASYVGGVAGTLISGTITNCYSTGDTSSSSDSDSYAGGIAGAVYNSGLIENSVAVNVSISAQYLAGRITADINNTPASAISNNFALRDMGTGDAQFDTSNLAKHGTDKTDAELRTQSTYSNPVNGNGLGGLGWKFGNDDENPWQMPGSDGYPILYWQPVTP